MVKKWYKVNLHSHTTLSDGELESESLIEEYSKRRYYALAITDHRREAIPYSYPRSRRILILDGVEVTRGFFHYTLIVGETRQLVFLNHPARFCRHIEDLSHYGFPIIESTDHSKVRELEGVSLDSLGIPNVYTDDSHRLEEIDRAWIEVRKDVGRGFGPRDRLIDAIQRGYFRRVRKE